ncbi:MAG: hypothetical protein V4450_08290, partial [Bacteroidota bacterium]
FHAKKNKRAKPQRAIIQAPIFTRTAMILNMKHGFRSTFNIPCSIFNVHFSFPAVSLGLISRKEK